MFMLSVVFNVNILLGNLSINVAAVSISQTFRAVIPACTMVCSFWMLSSRCPLIHLKIEKFSIENVRSRYTRATCISVLPVVFGTMLVG